MLEALKDKVDIEWFFEGWDNVKCKLNDFPINPIEAHNGIAVVPPNLGICFNTKGQGLFCPAFFHIPFRVSEIEVFAPCGRIYPAFQAQVLNNME